MVLEIDNLTSKAGDFVFGPLSLSLDRGDYLAVFGPSGSGKSLFLELIAGIRTQQKGKIIIDGTDFSNAPARKRPVAMLFQDYALFPHLNVYHNIVFPLKMRGLEKAAHKERVDELSEYLSIGHLLKRDTLNLSGGERQRVALARAIASKPMILLLDEPLSALDHHLRSDAIELLKKVNKPGITIIHVTHNREEIEELARKIIIFPVNGKPELENK